MCRPKEIQIGNSFSSDITRVFADTAGKHECINAATSYCHRSNVFGKAVSHHLRAKRAPSWPSSAAISKNGSRWRVQKYRASLIFVQHFINWATSNRLVKSDSYTPGSMSPQRVPITKPSIGVKPYWCQRFAVLMAVMDAPLLSGAIIIRMSSRGLPKIRAASGAT